jgi:membrane dipeptidase
MPRSHAATTALSLPIFAIAACAAPRSEADLAREARRITREHVVLDGHIDVPERLTRSTDDVSKRTATGDFDWERAKEGGLSAAFFSIFVPAEYETKGGAKAYAERLIDGVEKIAAGAPEKFALARTAADVRRIHAEGKVALLMGMENGSPIEGKLENVDHFAARGIRYITLCHGESNHIADSSYATTRPWRGLSPFGKEVVARMNDVGILVDVSHISDEAFRDVMEVSRLPVIASHSSCRHFTPGFERNMSDEMIVRLAARGGVIQINFGSAFLGNRFRERTPPPRADVRDVADHIDHVRGLVGIDHVGLGSDFDGVGDTLPTGLRDVSQYPNLVAELLRRGYSEDDSAGRTSCA